MKRPKIEVPRLSFTFADNYRWAKKRNLGTRTPKMAQSERNVGRAREHLLHFLFLARQVVCQAKQRIFDDDSVPAQEKTVSIFEPHTDIIRKDQRDTYYGHKICLTGGASNLILDCVILEGNPADSALTKMMLDRQNELYG